MSILVTGGGGFLGRYIVEQLLKRGEKVRVFTRGAYPELSSLGVEVIRGDLKNIEEVITATRNMETVFHVAAVPGIWGAWDHYYQTNTRGTENIIHGCLQAGVKKLIYTSSPSVIFDGHPHLDANESLPYPFEVFMPLSAYQGPCRKSCA